MIKNTFFRQWIFTGCALALLSGCAAAGRDYVRPDIKAPDSWNSKVNASIALNADKEWWESFEDKTLNRLIQLTAENNRDIASAKYALYASRAKADIAESSGLPSFTLSGSAALNNYGDKRMPDRTLDSYQAGFDAGWEIDIFGGIKRDIQAAHADADAQAESLKDVTVSLLAETATNYITARALQSSIKTAKEDIDINSVLLNLAEKRYKAGLTDSSDVQKARYTYEFSLTALNDYNIQLNEVFNRLAVLTGKNPGEADKMLSEFKDIPETPDNIAVMIPADVIRNRPDIRKAERILAAQTARTGSAVSELYPKFTLSGSIGYSADSAGNLFRPAGRVLGIGPSFRWAVFDLGSVKKNIKAQTETQKKYFSDYEAAVLNAFEDVENALNGYDQQKQKNIQMKKALKAAESAYKTETLKYNAGLSDYTAVKTAESAYISYKNSLAQGKAQADKYVISLYKALGGGWQVLGEKNEKTD